MNGAEKERARVRRRDLTSPAAFAHLILLEHVILILFLPTLRLLAAPLLRPKQALHVAASLVELLLLPLGLHGVRRLRGRLLLPLLHLVAHARGLVVVGHGALVLPVLPTLGRGVAGHGGARLGLLRISIPIPVSPIPLVAALLRASAALARLAAPSLALPRVTGEGRI